MGQSEAVRISNVDVAEQRYIISFSPYISTYNICSQVFGKIVIKALTEIEEGDT